MLRRFGYAGSLVLSASALACLAAFFLSSCAPTYPRENLCELVKTVCRAEYDMDVDASMDGSTLGIYYPMKGLLDVSMGISTDAWDKVSNLILVASRVVLSTDANIKFYCVITQDERLPEMQMIIIKYTDDVKKGMFRYIGRDESFKRTLFSINLTPQARKERSIERIFDKMGLEEDTRENVMSEFFRSPPSDIKDIGYWKDHFYLKDISLEEFLIAQIANRVKLDFQSDAKLKELFKFSSSEGKIIASKEEKVMVVAFKIFDQTTDTNHKDVLKRKVKAIVNIASTVVQGYAFDQFTALEMEDQLENVKLTVSSDDLYNYRDGKVPIESIVKASGEYF
ncbi:MAG: hypothetical protein HQL30_04125 [Candidatus Omnitrophica bacterium]|nr:hypothetical protein [Candidatus Omnitrophota bacterium]